MTRKIWRWFFIVSSLACVSVFFNNCKLVTSTSGADSLTGPDSQSQPIPNTIHSEDNGTAYNGPHLKVLDIPAADPTEQLGPSEFMQQIRNAESVCQNGDAAIGVLGLFPKIKNQILNDTVNFNITNETSTVNLNIDIMQTGGTLIQHWSSAEGFPTLQFDFNYTSSELQFLLLQAENNLSLMSLLRVNPQLPNNSGLIVTETKQTVDLSINTEEYLSCVQGILYSNGLESLMSSTSTVEDSDSCKILQPWFEKLNSLPFGGSLTNNLSDLAQIDDVWVEEYSLRNQIAKDIFESYLSGDFDPNTIKTCLGGHPRRQDFMNTLQYVFYLETIKNLSQSKSQKVQEFLAQLNLFSKGNNWTLFQLNGLGKEEQLEDASSEKAGAHRRQKNIFMDFTEVAPDEWYLIFIHEMSHRLDEKLFRSSLLFANDENKAKQTELLKHPRINSFNDISLGDRIWFQDWMLNGLNRGIFAEYRAWLASFELYSELQRENLVGNVSWLPDYLGNHNVTDTDFNCFLFDKLRSESSTTEIDLFVQFPFFTETKRKYLFEQMTCEAVQSLPTLN